MEDTILTVDELEQDNLTQEDNDLIEKEMNEAIDETLNDSDSILNDEQFSKEVDELFSTDDVEQRIEIFKKYHPNDKRFD